jgi:signal transduction histidine kinase
LRELVNEEHYEQVDAIVRNATKLKDIIESLSNVDNYDTGGATLRQGRTSIARIVEDVASSFRAMAMQKQITIKSELPTGDDLLVNVDASKISITLGNIVKNAIAFSSEGGTVVIKAENQQDSVKVSVKDDGVGIPAKDLPRVFERFFQVESHLTRRHGGMGLGLSVAKVMVEMHGGKIWAESTEGMGSTFIFVLPVEPPADLPKRTQPFL